MEPGVSTNLAARSLDGKALCRIVFDQKTPVNVSLGAISDGHVSLAQSPLTQRLIGHSSQDVNQAKKTRPGRNEIQFVSRLLENLRTLVRQAGPVTPEHPSHESRAH